MLLARDLAKSNDTAPGVAGTDGVKGTACEPDTEVIPVLASEGCHSGSFTWNELRETGLTLDVGHGAKHEKQRHHRLHPGVHSLAHSVTRSHSPCLPAHRAYVL